MKNSQILSMMFICAMTFTMQAKLVNGFSDIRAHDPHSDKQRKSASNKRIQEEIGTSVTIDAYNSFLNITNDFYRRLKSSKKPSTNDLQSIVAATIDLFRAYQQLPSDDQTKALENDLSTLKKNVNSLKLPSQVKNMLNHMATLS